MFRISKKWRVWAILVLAIALGTFVLEHFLGFNPVKSVVNVVTSPVKSGFSHIAYTLTEAREFVWDMRAYKEQNELLVEENLELKRENREIGAYKSENERLRALLDLNESSEDYTMVTAEVISHSTVDRFRQLEINKGTAKGIAKGNTVITPNGLVGTVTEAGLNFSIITTVLDPESIIGIKVVRTEGTGLLEGDSELVKNGECKLTFVDKNTPVVVGDIVETSGSGGVYPKGLAVGMVMTVSADRTGALNYAVVEPVVDFSGLREVTVITSVN